MSEWICKNIFVRLKDFLRQRAHDVKSEVTSEDLVVNTMVDVQFEWF